MPAPTSTTPTTSPAAAAPARSRTTFHPLRVARIERLCDDAAAITFDVPEELAGQYVFRPGQVLTVRREVDGREERRSYSICSPAGARLRIGVRTVPEGLFSTWLVEQLKPGDQVEAMAPTGAFTPDLTVPGHHVLIAAGSGITPMLSIAESVLAADPRSQVTLFYGNRRSDTVMFADELADLKDLYPDRFQIGHVLSREPRESELFSGRLDAERLTTLIPALIDPHGADHWWLCGPLGMVQDAQTVLRALGVDGTRVHRELFFAEDEPVTPLRHADDKQAEGPVSAVTVVLDGRATTATLPRDRSVLEGAQRSRPDLPFACKGGVCGTCRALVTDGTADMRRNFALEDAEVAAGYVLTCQTYPASDALTVDYDS